MAAGILPAPGAKNDRGEEIGPCVEPCHHKDCAQAKADAAQPCRFCGQPIGWDTRFYDEWEGGEPRHGHLVHALCLEQSIEAERAKR